MTEQASYIPALGHRALTPFYDVAIRTLLRERSVKHALIDRLALRPNLRVLDVGSGTATLALMMMEREPQVEVVGLDADPEIVELARKKVQAAGVKVSLGVASATELPYPDQSFDCVTSTFVVHHLTAPNKLRFFAEARRVLRPAGELHLVDIGPPDSAFRRLTARFVRKMGEAVDNLDGRIPSMLSQAGFIDVIEEAHVTTPLVALTFLCGRRE